MANAANAYVVPIGSGVASGIWGPNFNPKEYPVSPNGIFDIYDKNGNLDPRGPNASAIDTWNLLRLGYGTVDAPSGLGMGIDEAMRRYAGDPVTGQGGWDQRWNQWNATDVVDENGNPILLSPVHQTGLRVSQNYGTRNADGSPIDASQTDLWNTAKAVRDNLNQDPYLDPNAAISGLRSVAGSSAYDMPDPSSYVSGMRGAIGDAGDTDFYGQRGVNQTSALADTNIRQLTRGIDREMEDTLAIQLPEVQQAMAAAGLGRSGSNQLQMQNTMGDIMAQANRDKQRVMADYQDREANRQAAAINLGSQIGAQGQQNYSQLMGQGFLQGQNDLFQANQQGRQNEQALWSQSMQNRFAKNQGDQNALFQMLSSAGAQQNQRMGLEDQGRSMALSDWLGLQQNRDQTQANSLNQLLTLQNADRQIQQDRLNQMMQAGMQPWETQLRIATGTTAPSSPTSQPNSFWNTGPGQAVMNAGANWFTGGGPQQTYSDFQSLIG